MNRSTYKKISRDQHIDQDVSRSYQYINRATDQKIIWFIDKSQLRYKIKLTNDHMTNKMHCTYKNCLIISLVSSKTVIDEIPSLISVLGPGLSRLPVWVPF